MLMLGLSAELVWQRCYEAHIKKRASIAKTLSELNCTCFQDLQKPLHPEKVNSLESLGTENCSFVCFMAQVLPVEGKKKKKLSVWTPFLALIRKVDLMPITRSGTAPKLVRQVSC